MIRWKGWKVGGGEGVPTWGHHGHQWEAARTENTTREFPPKRFSPPDYTFLYVWEYLSFHPKEFLEFSPPKFPSKIISWILVTWLYLYKENTTRVSTQKIFFTWLGTLPKKKTGFFGNFSQVSDPPFWEPLFPKKKYGSFCILGPLEHFWSSSKCSLFGNYFYIYFWE